MDTEILKLDPPYNYIYCNGSIGLHIATLIVYEAKTNEDGEYQLETHSHPIVKYSERPGGTVWNRAELTDCNVLCSEADKRVTMAKFMDYIDSVYRARLVEVDTLDDCTVTINAPMWKTVLDVNDIEIEWPMIDDAGHRKPQDKFVIDLIIDRNPEGLRAKYTCHSYGAGESLTPPNRSLYIYTEFDNKKELELLLADFRESYYKAFRDHQFTIEYRQMNGSEFEKVLEKVNNKNNSTLLDSK